MNSISQLSKRIAYSSLSRPVSRSLLSKPTLSIFSKSYSTHEETDEAFDARWVKYFKNETLDLWELRKGLNEIFSHDMVPNPKILEAAMHASRKLNDHSVNVRILEGLREKAENAEMYDYVFNALKPTIQELGISTPEELGLDK
eukprot:Sdes_comp9401_c0_seq1m867